MAEDLVYFDPDNWIMGNVVKEKGRLFTQAEDGKEHHYAMLRLLRNELPIRKPKHD